HPTESGFTTDVLALYDWAKARSGDSPVIFWGHSLGTGIATNAARKLLEERGTVPVPERGGRRRSGPSPPPTAAPLPGVQVDAVVLESPYTNIRDAAAHVPITKIYRRFPGFEHLILDSMARGGMFFRSDE
ncbi:AB12B protein, partial [Eudromia elegans]|nr:AB12B protein [Eudromia elegans]